MFFKDTSLAVLILGGLTMLMIGWYMPKLSGICSAVAMALLMYDMMYRGH